MRDEALDVFLSYRRADKGLAGKLYKALSKRGLRVWMDLNELGAGELWSDEISRQISRCRLFVPLFTSSFDSDSFMAREITISMSDQSNRIDKERWFCPIYYRIKSVEFSNADMRDFVENRQILEMSRWGIGETADRIAALCAEDVLSLVNNPSLERAAQRYVASSYWTSVNELVSKKHYSYTWEVEVPSPRRLVVDFKITVQEDKWFNAKEWVPFSRKGEFQLVFTEQGTFAIGAFEKDSVQKLRLDFEGDAGAHALNLHFGREFIVPEEFCGSGQRAYQNLRLHASSGQVTVGDDFPVNI